jgi:hypothetical protein
VEEDAVGERDARHGGRDAMDMEVTRWRRRRYNPLYTAMIRNGQQRNGTLKTNLIIQRGEPKRKQKGAL